MLGKLLKYDLKWVYKIVIGFYILTIIFAVLTRICINIENSLLFNVLGKILNGTMIAMMVNALVNVLIRSWVRFIGNVYKDESYLTHTLPVKKKDIYLSKVLTAIICTFTTVAVALVGLFIAYYSKANMEALKNFLKMTASAYDTDVISLIIIVALVIFLESLFITLIGYVGIIIGHKSNRNKMAKTLVIGIVLYLVTSTLTLGIIYVIGLFNEGVMNVINTTDIVNVDSIKQVMKIGLLIYVGYNIMYYIIGWKQLEKGVNVD